MEPDFLPQIQNRIYEIRGLRVMLDRDLAALYGVDTKVLNQSVKRNLKRFPDDFMFQLTAQEFDEWRHSCMNAGGDPFLRSQNVTLETSRGKHTKYLPHAFAEQGVVMLSGILNSDRAIAMNIAIMRTFVHIRKAMVLKNDLQEQIREIRERIDEHDVRLNQLYDALENLLDEKTAQRNWENREPIGFRK